MLTRGDRIGPTKSFPVWEQGGWVRSTALEIRASGATSRSKCFLTCSSHPERLKRFEREARTTAALSHPNVVTVFDVGSHDGRAFGHRALDGSTLGDRLRGGQYPLRGRAVFRCPGGPWPRRGTLSRYRPPRRQARQPLHHHCRRLKSPGLRPCPPAGRLERSRARLDRVETHDRCRRVSGPSGTCPPSRPRVWPSTHARTSSP